MPGLEHDISGDGSQVVEEPVGGTTRDDGLSPGQHGHPGGGVEREGEHFQANRVKKSFCDEAREELIVPARDLASEPE
jgi:hypothetical protein